MGRESPVTPPTRPAPRLIRLSAGERSLRDLTIRHHVSDHAGGKDRAHRRSLVAAAGDCYYPVDVPEFPSGDADRPLGHRILDDDAGGHSE